MKSKFLLASVALVACILSAGCIVVLEGEGRAGFGFDTDTQAYVFHNVVRNSEQLGAAKSELKGSLADAIVGSLTPTEESDVD